MRLARQLAGVYCIAKTGLLITCATPDDVATNHHRVAAVTPHLTLRIELQNRWFNELCSSSKQSGSESGCLCIGKRSNLDSSDPKSKNSSEL